MLQNSDLFLNAVEKDSLDLAFQSSGIDQCVCGNIFGPRIRRYYLIHFVLDGFGVLQIEEKISGQARAGISDSRRRKCRLPGRFPPPMEILLDRLSGNSGRLLYEPSFGDGFVTDIQDVTLYEK